jgi:hypothetical protein
LAGPDPIHRQDQLERFLNSGYPAVLYRRFSIAKACKAPPRPGAVTEWPALECDWFEQFDQVETEANQINEARRNGRQ